MVVAGNEVASVMAVQLILLSRLGDWNIKMVARIKRFEGIGGCGKSGRLEYQNGLREAKIKRFEDRGGYYGERMKKDG